MAYISTKNLLKTKASAADQRDHDYVAALDPLSVLQAFGADRESLASGLEAQARDLAGEWNKKYATASAAGQRMHVEHISEASLGPCI